MEHESGERKKSLATTASAVTGAEVGQVKTKRTPSKATCELMHQLREQYCAPIMTMAEDSDTSWKSDSLSPTSDVEPKKWPEDLDMEHYNEISEYIREVDEILDLIKPFPRNVHPVMVETVQKQEIDPNINHLENLIKLVQHLKDLKEENTRLQEKSQYLKELKLSYERKKRLRQEVELAEERWKNEKEMKKFRPTFPFRKTTRGRSKSVNVDQFEHEDSYQQKMRRKSTATSVTPVKSVKAKVSKWTKVKEAFRWEKASEVKPGHLLQVPHDKCLDSPDSPVDSILSGQLSTSSSIGTHSLPVLSSGYSGEHLSEPVSLSSNINADCLATSLTTSQTYKNSSRLLSDDVSTSSSSEKLDEILHSSHLQDTQSPKRQLNLLTSGEEVSRRSKSLDGDNVLGPSSSFVQEALNSSKHKSHKTPWSKVKDIIQTRKDSLKRKKHRKRGSSKDGVSVSSDHEVDTPEVEAEDEVQISVNRPRIEVTSDTTPAGSATQTTHQNIESCVAARRLTPVLTLTLPSSEELRSLSVSETKSPEEELQDEKSKSIYQSNSSPNFHHGRFSKWGKVKRAFLSSNSPSRAADDGSNFSAPSSPNRHSSFFSDIESDELSSGEWTEDKTAPRGRYDPGSPSSPGLPPVSVQTQIQRDYADLQHKLDLEFQKKLQEWEKIRPSETQSTNRDERIDKGFQRKIEEWEKLKDKHSKSNKPKESLPLPKVDDLSPDFKKKLDEWKKIKKQPSAAVQTQVKEDPSPHFKMKIGEWQRWRPGSHKSDGSPHTSKQDQNLPEDFVRKLEEWQKMKGFTPRRSQSQSEKDESGLKTPSPRLSRKDSKDSTARKVGGSDKSSGTESLSGSMKDKEGRRKSNKEKDLQWLEKELHKIEREKLRLETEKKKYLEREARLEQMKRTMGTSPTKQVLIETAEGFFKFEGISQKFTKKLYEWEKAKGIAPEASTFALLEEASSKNVQKTDADVIQSLQRSISAGSVIELSTPTVTHHPSSLSLNNVDDLEVEQTAIIDDSRTSSEPAMDLQVDEDEAEPEAVIVDVEDVIVETAAILVEVAPIKSQVPVYSYAPSEITRLIDSSGSEGEREIQVREDTEYVRGDEVENVRHDLGSRRSRRAKFDVVEGPSCSGVEYNTDPRQEKVSLTHQSTNIAHDIVDNLKQINVVSGEPGGRNANVIQDLSHDLIVLAEKLECDLNENKSPRHVHKLKSGHQWVSEDYSSYDDLKQNEGGQTVRTKMEELKRGLDRLKNVSDKECEENSELEPVTSFTFRVNKKRGDSGAQNNKEENTVIIPKLEKSKVQSLEQFEAEKIYKENQIKPINSPEMIKKKIKEKISLMQKLSTEVRPRVYEPNLTYNPNVDDDNVEDETYEERAGTADDDCTVVIKKNGKTNKSKKMLKTRRVTDTTIGYKQNREEGNVDQTLANIIVPTTRKIFSPVMRDSRGEEGTVMSYVVDDVEPTRTNEEQMLNKSHSPSPGATRMIRPTVTETDTSRLTKVNIGEERKSSSETNSGSLTSIEFTGRQPLGMPPLPNSPSPNRKPAPGIRMMIAKYNQKLTGQENVADTRSGTASPAWRSPVTERRVKVQSEKYQEEVRRVLQHGGKFSRREVCKSASTGFIQAQTKSNENIESSSRLIDTKGGNVKGILKSSSTGAIKLNVTVKKFEREDAQVAAVPDTSNRALRLKKAKEEFLSRGPGGQSWTSETQTPPVTPIITMTEPIWRRMEDLPATSRSETNDRLSQVSGAASEISIDEFDSDNNNLLIKSASAGMINVEQIKNQSQVLPKSVKFGFSSITSKFRKVKMRKSKEQKVGAVSTLCRQSLFLDVDHAQENKPTTSKSCPSSPVLERSKNSNYEKSWKSSAKKIFKPKDKDSSK